MVRLTDSVTRQSEHKKNSWLEMLLCHIIYMSERVLFADLYFCSAVSDDIQAKLYSEGKYLYKTGESVLQAFLHYP